MRKAATTTVCTLPPYRRVSARGRGNRPSAAAQRMVKAHAKEYRVLERPREIRVSVHDSGSDYFVCIPTNTVLSEINSLNHGLRFGRYSNAWSILEDEIWFPAPQQWETQNLDGYGSLVVPVLSRREADGTSNYFLQKQAWRVTLGWQYEPDDTTSEMTDEDRNQIAMPHSVFKKFMRLLQPMDIDKRYTNMQLQQALGLREDYAGAMSDRDDLAATLLRPRNSTNDTCVVDGAS